MRAVEKGKIQKKKKKTQLKKNQDKREKPETVEKLERRKTPEEIEKPERRKNQRNKPISAVAWFDIGLCLTPTAI